jgi:two-component system CitB family response regulator
MRVLVVEESPALSARLLERLERVPGLVVLGVARSVGQAVRVMPVLTPDLVITDTELADGSGLALLHVLQAARTLTGMGPRVLLWTACQDSRRRSIAQGLGAEAWFDKARELDSLVEYCRRAAVHHA